MSIRLPPRRNRAATLLALLLLVLRLAVPACATSAKIAGEDAFLAQAVGGVVICHADAGPAVPSPGKPALPSAHDCLLCPMCQLAAPALLPAAAWVMALPLAGEAGTALPPPSTGPPQPRRYASRPRGPPAASV